jgi:hypothetical protein
MGLVVLPREMCMHSLACWRERGGGGAGLLRSRGWHGRGEERSMRGEGNQKEVSAPAHLLHPPHPANTSAFGPPSSLRHSDIDRRVLKRQRGSCRTRSGSTTC